MAEAAVRTVADEGDLCRLWAARAFPAEALVTSAGESLHVVYPGQRGGAGGGPDFRGAILATASGHLRTGDVEIHLRARDWIAHGHGADPAYNGVTLHVVLEDDGSPCLRADGQPVAVLALGAWVTAPLTAALDEPMTRACRVSPALLARDVRAIVHAAGRVRLDAKAAMLEAQIVTLGTEQALFAALLDAAGYSRNRAPCGLLAERLPVERLQHLLAGKGPERAPRIASAVLLGLAGLLAPGADDGLRALWAEYADLWPLPPLRPDHWVRAGVRPANRPELRLRGIAALLARHADGLARGLLAPLYASDAQGLLTALEVSAEPGDSGPAATPIGPGRATEMAVNVAAPFALALARLDGDREGELAAWRTVAALPGGDNSEPLRHMHALLARSGHRLRGASALEQQGLLHLYRSHCAVQACWDCPLAQSS